jgi:predicted AAA+ superfamily ATPase
MAHPLKKAVIVTRDEETTFNEEGLAIDVVPVWKWLLSPMNN